MGNDDNSAPVQDLSTEAVQLGDQQLPVGLIESTETFVDYEGVHTSKFSRIVEALPYS